MEQIKRLYLFTGKGGVGKTTISLAFAKYLQEQGNTNVEFICLDDFIPTQNLKKLKVKYHSLNYFESIKEYVQAKFGPLISSFIVRTSFFKAIINMVPGLSYLIFLLHIIEKLKKDPNLTVVFDSPSSGHTLVMLESLRNFQDIFKAGVMFNDIGMIKKFIGDRNNIKINICSLPTLMAINEALELKDKIEELDFSGMDICINNSYIHIEELRQIGNKPEFLEKKLNIEKSIIDKYYNDINIFFPYMACLEDIKIIENLVPLTGDLV